MWDRTDCFCLLLLLLLPQVLKKKFDDIFAATKYTKVRMCVRGVGGDGGGWGDEGVGGGAGRSPWEHNSHR